MELLKAIDLVKRFGNTNAVKGINFHIEEGRCVSLLGPNGAGKTTTLKMLSGLLEPTSGSINFKGEKAKDLRQFIGYLPQYPAFYNWMTGKEFLVFAGQLAKLNRKEAEKRSEENLVTPVDEENMSGIEISAQRITETYTGDAAATGTPEAENPTDNLVDYVEGTNGNGDYERIEETINNEVNRIRKEILESPYKVKNIGIQAMVEPPEGNDQVAVREEIERMLAAIVRTSLDAETANILTDEQIANNIVVAVQPLYGSTANDKATEFE